MMRVEAMEKARLLRLVEELERFGRDCLRSRSEQRSQKQISNTLKVFMIKTQNLNFSLYVKVIENDEEY